MRLTAELWVQAYLARLRLAAIPAYVMARGDPTAGAVMVVQSRMDGTATLHQRVPDLMTGERRWAALAEGTDAEIAAAVERQRRSDRDLWVIEVEDRHGRHLLDEEGLSS